MRWPWQTDESHDLASTLKEERAKTHVVRAEMAEAVINLNRERNALDEMVRRHLDLLAGNK